MLSQDACGGAVIGDNNCSHIEETKPANFSLPAGQKINLLLLSLSRLCRSYENHAKCLGDVGWCSKEVLLPSKALWTHRMCCSVASQ